MHVVAAAFSRLFLGHFKQFRAAPASSQRRRKSHHFDVEAAPARRGDQAANYICFLVFHKNGEILIVEKLHTLMCESTKNLQNSASIALAGFICSMIGDFRHAKVSSARCAQEQGLLRTAQFRAAREQSECRQRGRLLKVRNFSRPGSSRRASFRDRARARRMTGNGWEGEWRLQARGPVKLQGRPQVRAAHLLKRLPSGDPSQHLRPPRNASARGHGSPQGRLEGGHEAGALKAARQPQLGLLGPHHPIGAMWAR